MHRRRGSPLQRKRPVFAFSYSTGVHVPKAANSTGRVSMMNQECPICDGMLPSVQFHPVIVCNFKPVVTKGRNPSFSGSFVAAF